MIFVLFNWEYFLQQPSILVDYFCILMRINTFLVNYQEMWSLFDFVHQGTLLGTARTFKMEYENPITRVGREFRIIRKCSCWWGDCLKISRGILIFGTQFTVELLLQGGGGVKFIFMFMCLFCGWRVWPTLITVVHFEDLNSFV